MDAIGWRDLLTALGLMLVVEGILPFLNPRGVRELMARLSGADERMLRWTGLSSMLLGLIVLYLIR